MKMQDSKVSHFERLHKPVNILDKHEEDKELDEALRSNLNSALHAALLLLPGDFAHTCRLTFDLFSRLVGKV